MCLTGQVAQDFVFGIAVCLVVAEDKLPLRSNWVAVGLQTPVTSQLHPAHKVEVEVQMPACFVQLNAYRNVGIEDFCLRRSRKEVPPQVKLEGVSAFCKLADFYAVGRGHTEAGCQPKFSGNLGKNQRLRFCFRMPDTYLTLPEIRKRIRHWCAYQERSQAETRRKLRELGLEDAYLEEELTSLLTEEYVSDARFAIAYVRGHLSKGWGRKKIIQGLQAHDLPHFLTETTLREELDPEAYTLTLDRLLTAKRATLTDKNPLRRNYKLVLHLEQKGYTRQEIQEALRRAGLWQG